MPTHYTVPADGPDRPIHAERTQILADTAAWNRWPARINAKALAAGLVTTAAGAGPTGQPDRPSRASGPGGATMSRPLSAILTSGELDSYRAGAPPVAPGWADASETDARICARSRCVACGHRGLDYRPFTRPGSYRAFAVCPTCGAAQEF